MIFNVDILSNKVLLLFLVSLFVQLIYYFFFYIRLSSKKKSSSSKNNFPISVIIAARNEEINLLNFLPSILEQNYNKYEVVVVNDRSWDETLDVLLAFEHKYPHLRIVDLPDLKKDGYAKKMAITLGIKGANYDRMVFIDADCKPVNEHWLSEMVKGFENNKMLVLGAGPYRKTKGFLNKLIRFDSNFIAMQYLSFAKAGIPYMGVGRNLAYSKELYDSVRGFKSHYHIPSGDDDLFVNEAGTRKNCAVVFNKNAVTFSEPKKTYSAWWQQKKRHLTTGGRYKYYQLFLLGLYPISLIVLYLTYGVLLAQDFYPLIISGLLLFRTLVQILIFLRPFKIMGSSDLILFAPFLEFFFIFFNPLLLLKSKRL